MVSEVGFPPESGNANRIENIGIARTTRISRPPKNAGHGRRWTTRLHLNHRLCSRGLGVVVRRIENRSMVRPANPRMAGSSVMDANMMMATVTDVPTAIPFTKSTPIRNRPSSEITTVVPANTTARPAVSMARTTACWGSKPSLRPWRYRVTMNSA